MSEQTKHDAQNAEHNLRNAEEYLGHAERSFKQAGDKSLTQKVTKLREATHEVRKELVKKLTNG